MKFSYLSYILLVSSLILFMGSCSDDDPEIITLEPEPEIELPNSIAYNTGMPAILAFFSSSNCLSSNLLMNS